MECFMQHLSLLYNPSAFPGSISKRERLFSSRPYYWGENPDEGRFFRTSSGFLGRIPGWECSIMSGATRNAQYYVAPDSHGAE